MRVGKWLVRERAAQQEGDFTRVGPERNREQLAHLSESVAAYQFFRDVKTPISQQEARRIAFISWLVFRRLLSEYPDWEQRPRRFVSHDPRKCFQP